MEAVGRRSLVTWSAGRMRCCPADGFCHLCRSVGRSTAETPAGNEQEELNESRPQLPFAEIGCDFLNSRAIYSSGTQLPWRSRLPFRRQTLPSPGSAQSRHGQCQPPQPIPLSALPSSLLSSDEPREFNGTCLVRERRLGVTKWLNSKCCLSKTPQKRAHLLTHQQDYF